LLDALDVHRPLAPASVFWGKRLASLGLLALCGFALGVRPAEAAEKKRPLPDYGDRSEPEDKTLRAALWVPRALLYPVYLSTEYLVRRPLGKLLTVAEAAGVPALLYDILAFGPDHKAGIFPTLFVDSGFQPSVGGYGFWDDAFVRGHQIRVRASFSGNAWISAGFSERFAYGPDPIDRAGWEAAFLRRPDYLYFGTGSSTLQADALRYGMEALQFRAMVDKRLWRLSSLHAQTGVRFVGYNSGVATNTTPTLDSAIANGTVAPPPLYPAGYDEVRSELLAILDSRDPQRPASGVRVAGQWRQSFDPRQMGSWVRYAATIGGFVDLDGHRRILSLATGARFVDPLGNATVPFTELAALGGDSEAMVGFYQGRLLGRSAVALSLAYRWPVWVWMDGVVRFEVGNVFDEHLQGFRPGLLRYSTSIAVESRTKGESEFQAVLGFGSNTFESGGSVDSVRVAVGTSYDF
jgi:hypothetical protein